MKRFLVIILCVVLIFALPIVAFAEEDGSSVETETPFPDTETPDTEPPAPEKSEEQTNTLLPSDIFRLWVQEHIADIILVCTALLAMLVNEIKNRAINKSIGTLNNNAVAVAENSSTAIGEALTSVSFASAVVEGYKNEVANLLAEVRANEEEKQKLASTLTSVEKYLTTTKAANIELANEVAELLVLANIPNSKKEELYSRHRAAVDAITAFENSEVNEDDPKVA